MQPVLYQPCEVILRKLHFAASFFIFTLFCSYDHFKSLAEKAVSQLSLTFDNKKIIVKDQL